MNAKGVNVLHSGVYMYLLLQTYILTELNTRPLFKANAHKPTPTLTH